MVTLMKIPEENINLVIDSTNSCIGVLYNGEIYMFSEGIKENIKIMYIPQWGYQGPIDVGEIMLEVGKSYSKEITLDELENKYGVKAQEEALESIEKNYQKLNNLEINIKQK